MTVILRPLPHVEQRTVVVGTTLRKKASVLSAHLQTLAWQEWPERVNPYYVFVDDGLTPDARAVLDGFLTERTGEVLDTLPGTDDFSDQGPVTHHWTHTAMARVGQNKNRILKRAVELKVKGVWFCDADLLLDRTTFASLWDCDVPVACAVYWTIWNHHPGLSAAPQVWLQHPYGLDGRGYDAAEFRRRLLEKERLQVWGQGACTLIRTPVIEKGVSFDYVPGVKLEGMMAGEDRHFCLRCEALHIPMYADPWPDIFHIFHPQDEERIPEMLARLGQVHRRTPSMGDWISLRLEALEPVMLGQPTIIPPQFIRGRLGSIKMLPDLEDVLHEMTRGETRIIPVHFPSHYEAAPQRGQRRLVRVTLLDAKPFGFPPVVEEELLIGAPGIWADRTTLTKEQQPPCTVPQ